MNSSYTNNTKVKCSSETNIIIVCVLFFVSLFAIYFYAKNFHREHTGLGRMGELNSMFMISGLCAFTIFLLFLIPIFSYLGASCYYPYVIPFIFIICVSSSKFK